MVINGVINTNNYGDYYGDKYYEGKETTKEFELPNMPFSSSNSDSTAHER